MSQIIVSVYLIGIVAIVLFQIALIAGMPWGEITQGGQVKGSLGVKGKFIAVVSVPILIFMALAASSAASLWPNWPIWTGWVAMVVQTQTTVLNWITPSKAEKKLWGPITAVMLVLLFYLVVLG